MKKRGVNNPNCAGDGAGYPLTIQQHYASSTKKLKDKSNKGSKKTGQYIFSFRFIDLDTRLYIGYGTGFKSEQEAFYKTMEMMKLTSINSIRLDKYYAVQKYVKFIETLFGKNVSIYVISKKNATIKGPLVWKQMLEKFMNDTKGYLG